ncbi:hypothetical protein GmHk_04G009218 [Glycine max]|nr:hypothetical protein GmHk_04G009218 [Glycine max]
MKEMPLQVNGGGDGQVRDAPSCITARVEVHQGFDLALAHRQRMAMILKVTMSPTSCTCPPAMPTLTSPRSSNTKNKAPTPPTATEPVRRCGRQPPPLSEARYGQIAFSLCRSIHCFSLFVFLLAIGVRKFQR